MRTIKFRGKAAESGRWIYGDLIENQGDFHIYHATSETTLPWDCDTQIAVCAEKVDFKTVGQFTGLHDTDGKEIYEGDIVKIDFLNRNSAIEYNKDAFMASINSELSYYVYEIRQSCRIIGNIHDTPELLKRR